MNQESYFCERIRFILAQAQEKLQSTLNLPTVQTSHEIIITMEKNQEGEILYDFKIRLICFCKERGHIDLKVVGTFRY